MGNNIIIGIILRQDCKKDIRFSIPPQAHYIWHGSKAISLSSNNSYVIATNRENMELYQLTITESRKFLDVVSETAYLANADSMTTAPEKCVCVYDIVVGRNFHWKKTMHQIFPGKLYFHIDNGFMVMTNKLELETYIACVAVSEMNPDCPAEFIRSQIICARSWFLAHAENKHASWAACNDDCCQRYQGLNNIDQKIWEIAKSVQGIVLLYRGKICDARYSKSCGGITEASSYVWPTITQDYLKPVYDGKQLITTLPNIQISSNFAAWLDNGKECFCSPASVPSHELKRYLGKVDTVEEYFRWEKHYSSEDLVSLLQQKLHLPIYKVLRLYMGQRGCSGRLQTLSICYEDEKKNVFVHHLTSEYQIREALHPSFLYSSAFTIDETRKQDDSIEHIRLRGVGWGHGVGLCQIGALGMALQGYSYEEILKHYFIGVEIGKI